MMYIMNEVALGQVLAILSSCVESIFFKMEMENKNSVKDTQLGLGI